jgi:hypothetical protein
MHGNQMKVKINYQKKNKSMKRVFMVAIVFAAFTANKANAQKGFSVSVKATPQFSFLQNKDDRDKNGP